MEVKFKLLSENAKLPYYSKEGDAGLDLTASAISFDSETSTITYKTGVAVEIPEGFVGLLYPRSSIYKKDLTLCNSVGVIDSNYRGEIVLKFRKTKDTSVNMYIPGERVGQLVITPIPTIEPRIVSELESSNRGDRGFGSSGR